MRTSGYIEIETNHEGVTNYHLSLEQRALRGLTPVRYIGEEFDSGNCWIASESLKSTGEDDADVLVKFLD